MLQVLLLTAAEFIVMDGNFDDWTNISNTICVDADDAPAGGPDLGVTKWSANADRLHLWLELCQADGPMLNLQAMDSSPPETQIYNGNACGIGVRP